MHEHVYTCINIRCTNDTHSRYYETPCIHVYEVEVYGVRVWDPVFSLVDEEGNGVVEGYEGLLLYKGEISLEFSSFCC